MGTSNRIPTNLRTLMILEVMGRTDRALTPTEINEELGLPKQTIHRLCTTLIKEGFLSRELTGKGLRSSRRAREMGLGLLHASHTHIARHQVLVDIANSVKETVNFVVPEKSGMRYLDRVDTDWPFRIQLPIGSNVPFHCTASGKTFIASMSAANRKAFVNNLTFERLTPNTHVSTESLLAELDKIAERGYAIDNQEFMEGMVALAVPVKDHKSRFVGALAFHGPTQRLTVERAVSFQVIMMTGAGQLREALF